MILTIIICYAVSGFAYCLYVCVCLLLLLLLPYD